MARRGELMEVQRWTREHACVGHFGRAQAYGHVDGPGPVAGLLVGVVIALGGWVVPQMVDLVRSPPTRPVAPAVSPATSPDSGASVTPHPVPTAAGSSLPR